MKLVLILLAWVSFSFGIIGAFLPVLPTTPFLILSAFLFSKSSPRFYSWLLALPVAGEGIRDWQNNRVIRPRAKVLCSLMIFFSLILIHTHPSINFMIKWPVSIILLSVCAFVVSRKSRV